MPQRRVWHRYDPRFIINSIKLFTHRYSIEDTPIPEGPVDGGAPHSGDCPGCHTKIRCCSAHIVKLLVDVFFMVLFFDRAAFQLANSTDKSCVGTRFEYYRKGIR